MSGETEADTSGWTVDTLRADILARMDLMQKMLDERYATQTKALDAAFLAQQTAVTKALEAQEKSTSAAQAAAERANAKAETAAEKRFDLMNEFRGQLSDQASTFMPRAEAEALAARLAERLQDLNDRNTEHIQGLTDRMNRSEGSSTGAKDNRAAFIAAAALVVSVLIGAIALFNFIGSQ